MKKSIYSFLIATALAGCAAGKSFEWGQARQIKEGMTEEQVVAIMGEPSQVRSTEEGQQLWQWVYVDWYGLSGGTKTLSIPIRDGKVLKTPSIPISFK